MLAARPANEMIEEAIDAAVATAVADDQEQATRGRYWPNLPQSSMFSGSSSVSSALML